ISEFILNSRVNSHKVRAASLEKRHEFTPSRSAFSINVHSPTFTIQYIQNRLCGEQMQRFCTRLFLFIKIHCPRCSSRLKRGNDLAQHVTFSNNFFIAALGISLQALEPFLSGLLICL